ncbi:hypothetical protein PGR6_25760 [Pseudomonas sp. GR 6-02]|nr:hypothetical protein PGR6_25760 [Pseudomonas sp. GR 6-02]
MIMINVAGRLPDKSRGTVSIFGLEFERGRHLGHHGRLTSPIQLPEVVIVAL